MTAKKESMHVYKAIAEVTKQIATQGVAKSQKNNHQGYNFRGIDQVYNALAPILSNAGLIILPRVKARSERIVQTQKGYLNYVTVEVDYTIASAEDGSTVECRSFGEAMDSGDKATNKAMSAAYKYLCFQAFCIPTEAQDADYETHQPIAPPQPAYACELAQVMADGDDINTCQFWRELTQEQQQWEWSRIDKECQKHLKAILKEHPAPMEAAS